MNCVWNNKNEVLNVLSHAQDVLSEEQIQQTAGRGLPPSSILDDPVWGLRHGSIPLHNELITFDAVLEPTPIGPNAAITLGGDAKDGGPATMTTLLPLLRHEHYGSSVTDPHLLMSPSSIISSFSINNHHHIPARPANGRNHTTAPFLFMSSFSDPSINKAIARKGGYNMSDNSKLAGLNQQHQSLSLLSSLNQRPPKQRSFVLREGVLLHDDSRTTTPAAEEEGGAASCSDHQFASFVPNPQLIVGSSAPGYDPSSTSSRFRPYQADLWRDRFLELIEFRQTNGHCLVPHSYPPSQQLAQWVKRQRYQYKLKSFGHHSTLTDARQDELEKMGFVWDSHKAVWLERFESLKSFQQQFRHCHVPSGYSKALAVWVKCQRRQLRLFQRGEKSTLTEERYLALEEIRFDWNPRNLLSAAKSS